MNDDKVRQNQAALFLLALSSTLPNLTVDELLAVAMDSLHFDYFLLASALHQLEERHLLTCSLRKNESERDGQGRDVKRLDLTQEGQIALQNLRHNLPSSLQAFLRSKEKDIPRRKARLAHYQLDGDYGFLVELGENERERELVYLRLHVPEETIAQKICLAWRSRAAQIYSILLAALTQN